jgi:RNA polymerase sigma-70 factor (ECF subfamily)
MQASSTNGYGPQCAPPLGRFEYGIVKRKVSQIIGRAGFTRQDRKDLEQELIARLLQGLKSFDPKVAHRKIFVTTVVERAFRNVLRDKQAEKRDHRRICSLHLQIQVTDDGPTDLAKSISDRELDSRRRRDPRSAEELSELASDLDEVLASLPEELRDLAERLKTQSISAIARELGVPRTTLNDRVRQLRKRFQHTGLRDYL